MMTAVIYAVSNGSDTFFDMDKNWEYTDKNDPDCI